MSGPTPPPWAATVAAPPRRRPVPGRPVIWAAGIVVVVIGTFLPWLRSGRVQRNSYELAGVGVRRLQAADWVEVLLRAWPFLGLLWAVAVVLMVLGRVRPAGVLAVVLAVLTGLIALGGLYLAVRLDSGLLGGVVAGPLVTAVGAVVVALTSASILRHR